MDLSSLRGVRAHPSHPPTLRAWIVWIQVSGSIYCRKGAIFITSVTDPEICALIEYTSLYHAPYEDGSNVWSIHDRQDFWENCSLAVMQCTGKSRRSCSVILFLHIQWIFYFSFIFQWAFWIYFCIALYIIRFYIFLQYLYLTVTCKPVMMFGKISWQMQFLLKCQAMA